jgi:hypothetical protein
MLGNAALGIIAERELLKQPFLYSVRDEVQGQIGCPPAAAALAAWRIAQAAFERAWQGTATTADGDEARQRRREQIRGGT